MDKQLLVAVANAYAQLATQTAAYQGAVSTAIQSPTPANLVALANAGAAMQQAQAAFQTALNNAANNWQ